MICELPDSIVLGGTAHPIRTDFRVILRIFAAWRDPALTDAEKCIVCLLDLYVHPARIGPDIAQEAVREAYRFCAGGALPEDTAPGPKLYDWVQDERIMMPAVSRAAGVTDVRALPYLHWWSFLGLFGEMPEGLFTTVLHIRQKRAEGKPLEKWEAAFLRKNKSLVVLHTAEEQAAIDKTEAFLKTIL